MIPRREELRMKAQSQDLFITRRKALALVAGAGGAEFLACMLGATEQDIKRKIEDLRPTARKYDNASFAVGGCVADDADDMQRALRLSDE